MSGALPSHDSGSSAAAIGAEVFTAERDAVAVTPFSTRYPGLDVATAYAAQEHYVALRRAAGARHVGRKIGATSRAIQDRFDVRTPDYGRLFDDMRIPDGGRFGTARLIAPMVEPEVAFVLGHDLAGPGLCVADVLAATSAIHPAIEIIDSRVRDWRITFEDTVADNGSSARFVLGPAADPGRAAHLDRVRVVLTRGDAVVGDAYGAEVLGHPARAVAWLAESIGRYGGALAAGDIVLSGSFTGADPVVPGERYVAQFDTIGAVACVATDDGTER